MPIFNNNAAGLINTTGVVNVANALAPTAGQVLTATDGYNATWTTAGAGASGIIQTAFISLSTDVSTTSATLVDVTGVTITITTGAHNLYIWWSSGIETSSAGATAWCSVLIDGVAIAGVASKPGGSSSTTVAIVHTEAVSAGSHTIKTQWRISAGTLSCNVATNPTSDNMTLMVMESSV